MPTLIADLIDRVQLRADNVDTRKRARVLDALDEAVQWYVGRVPMSARLRNETFLASGSEFMVFPDRVLQVLEIGDLSNQRIIEPGSQFRRRAPGAFFNKTSGTAYEWERAGVVSVIAQPHSDTTLTVQANVSDSFDCYVRGLVRDTTASGTPLELQEIEETISITNSETNLTVNLFVNITDITKQRPTVANLNITENLNSRLISRIPLWEGRPLYKRIRFVYVPPVNTQIDVEYYRRPDRLHSETQGIDIDIDEEALIWRAAGNLHWMDQEGQSAQRAWQLAEQILTTAKTVEEQFGEQDFHVEPTNFYFDAEGLNDNLA